MRLKVFRKAKYFIEADKVKISSITPYSISFEVGDFHVTAKYKSHQLIWLCSCKADLHGDICSHKIAAQTYLTNLPKEFYQKQSDLPANDESLTEKKEIFKSGLIHLTPNQKYVLRQMVCFKCQDCHKHEDEVGKLEPHRIIRGADGGLYIPQNIKMLCKECHDRYDY